MYSLLFLATVSLAFSLVLTPLIRNAFLRVGVLDAPDASRKHHDRPTPRAGGIAIALAYTLAFALLLATKLNAGTIIWDSLPLIAKLLPAAGVIFVIGLLDDLMGLRPLQKLAGQTFAAFVAYLGGIQIVAVGGAN